MNSTPNIEDRLSSFPVGWRPKAGDKLTGIVVEVSQADSTYGEPYPLIVVRRQDGQEIAVHAFHTVLKRELARLRPKPGDTIGIGYHGKDQERGYERYRVVLEREEPAEELDWDAMAEAAEAEEAGPA